MGLLSWIKNKYYDHKLNQADKNVANGDIENAQLIYESLLGKQKWAPTHLARLLVDNAPGVSEKQDVLKRLLDLRQYIQGETEEDYSKVLEDHVSNIETLASERFIKQSYKDSVALLSSIKEFRQGKSFEDKINRYKAYSAFTDTHAQPLKNGLFSETVNCIRAISKLDEHDLEHFAKTLAKNKQYARAIILLLQFIQIGNWVKKSILDYSVEIVSGKDSEITKPKKISDFCDNNDICISCAKHLAECANKKASLKDYTNAVLFDTFAADYLSEDNNFNFNRCKHILEELSVRADAIEISELNKLAVRLKLTEGQQQFIEKRVFDIAKNTEAKKSIAICRLYIVNHTFAGLYIVKSLEALKKGDKVDVVELRSVIGQETDNSNLPDQLALFVPYISSYKKDFLVSAIRKIKYNSSTEYLSKYWSVLPNPIWIRETVNKNEHSSRDFAIYISQHADKFLCDKVYRDTFCEAVKSLGDDDFYLSILERLIKSGQDFKDAYITHILDLSKLQSKTNNSLLIVNRGLSNVASDKLISVKKHLISGLINEGQLDDAETEIKSILNKDSEAPTLLVELYWGRADMAQNNHEKIEWFFKLLDVDENNTLQKRAQKLIEQSLIELTAIAKSEYKSNNKNVAYAIAERVKGYSDYWIPLFIWLRNNDRAEGATLNQNIKYDYETLKEITESCPSSKEFNHDDFNIMWKNYADNVIKKAKVQPLDKAIVGLESLREFEKNGCPNSIENILLQEASSILIKTKWTLGLEKEQDADYSEAIKLYDEIASDCIQSFVTRAELRSLISHVKSNNVDSTVESAIEEALKMHSYQTLKEDLAFRYACYLLQCTRPSDAERIIRTHLPEETQILNICENVYVKEAEKSLETFNSLVKKMNEGKMSLSEAIEFKQNIQTFKKRIIGRLTDLSRSFGMFQPKVEDYILYKMFEEEAYSELLTKMMAENPNYIENDVDFRNIAIASLGLLESDIDDTSILKRAIATILTAIYSDRLFVQSLDQTSWDDKYTFTLDGSFGGSSIDDYEELPENVNFDYAVENVNVAIRDVQNSLLTRVETVVRKKHPDLEKFLTDEKNALDKIIELNLDKAFILASPHLCRTLASIRMSIENSFEYELNQNYGNKEDVIALGVDYGFHGGEYDEYRKAYNCLLFCKSSVSSTPATTPSATFTQEKINLIKRYDRLYSDLKSSIATAMNNDIKSDMDYRNFLDKYEVPCIVLKDTSLCYTCTNYVNGKLIQLLNSKGMKLREAVGYMVRLYNIAPTNEQIKNNTEGIVTSLVHEAEKSNSRADRLALNNAINNLHGAFGKEISLASIIAKVNNDRIEEYQALTQLYELYTKNPNSSEVCENLATIVKICIHKYFAGDTYSGRSEVRQTLNKLKINKSATFKDKARILALEYLKIMKEMPQDMRILLMAGVSLSGSTLSSKGQLLKEGLDYMKDLGNVEELLRKH